MLTYKTLEDTSIENLNKTFSEAFSDYQINLDVSILKLKNMLQRSGCVLKVSIGTFKYDTLVGFILNGIRTWDGKLTAYDTGTAVIKNYRKQGITSNMFQYNKKILVEIGIEQYLLEVIQTNISAVKLYKNQGFEILREFECFKIDKNKNKFLQTHKVEHCTMFNKSIWRELVTFWDSKPSWQNSNDSIKSVLTNFIYSYITIDEIIVGYGIIDKKTGDIPQIAVHKDYRGKGIGKSILVDLVKNTVASKISVLNVDGKCTSMINFLLQLGFEHYISQYEMILKL